MNAHTPTWTPTLGIGIPMVSQNFQKGISKIKTPWIKKFFILLECS
jgi:hypothetical protein